MASITSKIRINSFFSYLCRRYALEKTHICRLAAVGCPADGVPCAFPSSRPGTAGRRLLRGLLAASSASRAFVGRDGDGGVPRLPTAFPAICSFRKHGVPVVSDGTGSVCPSDSRGGRLILLPTSISQSPARFILPLVFTFLPCTRSFLRTNNPAE